MLPPSPATSTLPWPGRSSWAAEPDASRRAPGRTMTKASAASTWVASRLCLAPISMLPPAPTWPYTPPWASMAVAARPATSRTARSPIQIDWALALPSGRLISPPVTSMPGNTEMRPLAALSVPSTVIWPLPVRLMLLPSSTRSVAPSPTTSGALALRVPADSAISAPARCLSTPFTAFSCHSGASHGCSTAVGSAPVGNWSASARSARSNGMETSMLAPCATCRPCWPLML